MSTLKELMSAQATRGVALNMGTISALPLNDLKAKALQHPVMQGHAPILANPTTRNILFGNFFEKTRKYFFDLQGTLAADYAHLVVAYWAILLDPHYSMSERQLIEVLVRYIGAEQLQYQLKQLLSCARAGIVYPRFVLLDGVYTSKQGDLPVMQLMSLLSAPEGYSCYTVNYDDKVQRSFWEDLIGYKTKKLQTASSKVNAQWVLRCPDYLEKRLAPRILRGDFGNLNKVTTQAIVKYQDGKLLAYRKGMKGRKPNTVFPFIERMYPTLEGVLNERIARFEEVCRANNLAPDDAFIYYASPYFFCYAVKPKLRKLFSTFKEQAHAQYVSDFTEKRFLLGTML